ncbi:MAG: dephospho-CoA kinase [Chloroflexi bacterium]|nr:dephospho-CoA kinase [Chloroflexota bacterium]
MAKHSVWGLTGNIGAGKSTVGAMLRELGARVIDSDATVRTLLESDEAVMREVRAAFPAAQRPDGGIDRAAVAREVFADRERLTLLQDLLYPSVGEATDALLAEATDAPATFIEAINVVEGPSGGRLDGLWLVEADPAVLVERVTASGRLSAAQVQARLAMQAGPDEKAEAFRQLRPERPIVRLGNNGSLEELRTQVTARWNDLLGG